MLFPLFSYLILVYIFRFSPLVRHDKSAALVKKSLLGLKTMLENKDLSLSALLELLKTYIGAKLQSKAGSLTFSDIEGPLHQHDVSADTIKELRSVFETCEASHYAGGAFSQKDISGIRQKTLALVNEIERSYT
jgi:hypothetical protein